MKPKTDYGLTAHLAGELAISFVPLDLNHDGFIDAYELRESITRAMPPLANDKEVKDRLVDAILAHADTDDNGRVDFTEFSHFLETHRNDQAKTVSSLRHVAEESGLFEAARVITETSPATLRTLFVSFGSNGRTLAESCPQAPPAVLSHLKDVSQGTIEQLLKVFELLKYGGMKRRASLTKRSSNIAQLNSEDSIMRNPLSHLTQSQVNHLARHLRTDRPKQSPNSAARQYETVEDIFEVLREMFDAEARDALLEDAAEMLLTTYHTVDESTLFDFLASIHSFATNHVKAAEVEQSNSSAQVYTVSELEEATQSLLTTSLTNEEVDLLRDTFIRLDTDGDGFVSLPDCQRVAEDVLGAKFTTFLPYLNALFQIADKDADGSLSLSEFLLSFVEGPGVIPQEVITECVAAVKVRLVDAELLAIKVAFCNMDHNCDGTLDFKELSHAMNVALQPHVAHMSEEYVRDLVDAILSKADKDLDGKLNMSEFIRSVQEDHGVIPLQLVEHFAAVQPLQQQQQQQHVVASKGDAVVAKKSYSSGAGTTVGRPSSATGSTPVAPSAPAKPFNEAAVKALFRRADQNKDGLIVVGDIGNVLVRLLEKRQPQWTAEYYIIVAESLFANADRNGDGFVSLDDFMETFRSGYSMLPEGFSEELGSEIALSIDADARQALAKSLATAENDQQVKDLLRAAYAPKQADGDEDRLVFVGDYFAPLMTDRKKSYELLHLPTPQPSAPTKQAVPPQVQEAPIAAPIAQEAVVESEPEKAPLPLAVVGPQELMEAKKILRSLAQANAELPLTELQQKVSTALTELLFGDTEGAQELTNTLIPKLDRFLKNDKKTVQMETLSGMLLGKDVPAEEFGWTIPDDDDRLAAASSLLTDLLTSYGGRALLAEALLVADPLRVGELNYSALRSALVVSVPIPPAKRSLALRAIRNTGTINVMGLFTVSRFVEKFTIANYVAPAVPYPANSLVRWFTHHERTLLNEVLSTFDFTFEDDGAAADTKVVALQRAVAKAIAQQKELRAAAPVENLQTAARLTAELVVFGKTPLADVRKDPSALAFPWTLLPAGLRCDNAIRLLRVRVGEAAQIRRLLRCLLFADRNVNGLVPKLVLSEALTVELAQIQPTWSASKTQLVVDEFLLANEVDDKGFILIGKMIDTMTQQFSMVTPTQANSVFIETTLSDPVALSAALFHLNEKPSVPRDALRNLPDGGNGRVHVAPITKLFEDVCAVNRESDEVDIRPLFPHCTLHPKGLVVQLGGLDNAVAQKIIFSVLPVERQRYLASMFVSLDKSKDNVLDWDELQALLIRYTSTQGNNADPLAEAQKLFAKIDVLNMGLVAIEEFLAAIANGSLPSDALSDPTRPSTTPTTISRSSPQRGGNDSATPTKAKASKLKSEGLAEDDLREQFDKYDVNHNGYLDCNEFAVVYQKMEHYGLTPSLAEIRRLFRSICVSPNTMTFDEFCVLILRKSRM